MFKYFKLNKYKFINYDISHILLFVKLFNIILIVYINIILLKCLIIYLVYNITLIEDDTLSNFSWSERQSSLSSALKSGLR